jgi:hypothetical protein
MAGISIPVRGALAKICQIIRDINSRQTAGTGAFDSIGDAAENDSLWLRNAVTRHHRIVGDHSIVVMGSELFDERRSDSTETSGDKFMNYLVSRQTKPRNLLILERTNRINANSFSVFKSTVRHRPNDLCSILLPSNLFELTFLQLSLLQFSYNTELSLLLREQHFSCESLCSFCLRKSQFFICPPNCHTIDIRVSK